MSIFTNKKALIIAGIILIGGVSFGVHANSKQAKSAPEQKISLYEATNLTSLDASKITDGVSSAQLSQVDEGLYRLNKNNPELKTLSAGRVGFIQYNEKDKTAANKDLRTAISLTINRQQLVTKILENGSIAAKTFGVRDMLKNPKTGKDFVDNAQTPSEMTTNIAKAKTLYQTAQKQLGTKQLTLTITCANDDTSQQTATYIQGQLMNHLKNLKVNVRTMPFPSMLTKVSQGDFQLNLTSWGMDFADPSQVLTILTSNSNSNMGHYQSKTYDTDMNNADGKDAMNNSNRYQDLVKAAKIATKDQGVTPLYESRSRLLVNSNLHGVVYNKFNGAMDFRTAYVK